MMPLCHRTAMLEVQSGTDDHWNVDSFDATELGA